MLLGSKLLIDNAALRLPDTLGDDLLGLLGRNAAELFGLDGDIHRIAQLRPAADLLGRLQIDLMAGILHLVHHGLGDIHLDPALLLVQVDCHVILAFGVILAESGQHGLLDLVVHIAAGNALFLFDGFNRLKEFSVHL